jgi:hypothetical protein
MKLLKHIYLLCPLLSTVAAATEADSTSVPMAHPSSAVRVMPPEVWKNIGDFLLPEEQKRLTLVQNPFKQQFQNELQSAKQWADSFDSSMIFLKHVLNKLELNHKNKRHMEVLGIWDDLGDRPSIAVRLVMNPVLFTLPADTIAWAGISSEPIVDNILMRMCALRGQLSTPSGLKSAHEFYQCALSQGFPQMAFAIFSIIAPNSNQRAEVINKHLYDMLTPNLSEDTVIILISRIINAVDFNQSVAWRVEGLIRALNEKGFMEQANRLYAASQAENFQNRALVRFQITGKTLDDAE